VTAPDTGQTVARSFFFSQQTRPLFLRRSYIFVPSASSIQDFDALIKATTGGEITNVCVTALPETGPVSSCQNLFDRYAGAGKVVCTGYGQQSFEQLSAGACQAVWDGIPSNPSGYHNIPKPRPGSPVFFFRQHDLPPPVDPFHVESNSKTSLELAITHFYQALVGDGTWHEVFGTVSGIESTEFCSGEKQNWPILPELSLSVSDLQTVIERGTFRW